MQFKGEKLLLDNFRGILKDYTVDIQDVVRSAILDDIDLSPYIEDCLNSPYKLEQIRLALKDGLSSDFFKLSGDVIYKIRLLNKKGTSLSQIERQLRNGLNDEYMSYLVKWVDDGINISKLNIGIIPKKLLETFDYGLRNGFDMCQFNTGVSYSSKYIMLCLQILKNGKSVSSLLNGDWSLPCLDVLVKFSKSSETQWNRLISNVDYSISSSRLHSLCSICKSNIDLVKLQEKDSNGKYIYDDECLTILFEAFCSNLNLQFLLKETNPRKMRDIKNTLELQKKRKVSGRLIKN